MFLHSNKGIWTLDQEANSYIHVYIVAAPFLFTLAHELFALKQNKTILNIDFKLVGSQGLLFLLLKLEFSAIY